MVNSVNTKIIALAINNLKKNDRLMIPLVSLSSITLFLLSSLTNLIHCPSINMLLGGSMVIDFLRFGQRWTFIFSLVFNVYAMLFVGKKRSKEFTLFQLLGFQRTQLMKVIAIELAIIYSVATILEISFGIVFGRMIFLILCRVLFLHPAIDYSVSFVAYCQAIGLFFIIYCIAYSALTIQVSFSKEKERFTIKNQWIFSVISFTILCTAYGLALLVNNAFLSIKVFPMVIGLLIVGTYGFFRFVISDSISMMKKKTAWFYRPLPFTILPNLGHRVIDNASSLSIICILSTVTVLVLSMTTSLYSGLNESLYRRYSRQFQIVGDLNVVTPKEVDAYLQNEVQLHGFDKSRLINYSMHEVIMEMKNNQFYPIEDYIEGSKQSLILVNMMNHIDYNRISKENIELKDDEIIVFVENNRFKFRELIIDGKVYKIKKILNDFFIPDERLMMKESMYIVVNQASLLAKSLIHIPEYGRSYCTIRFDSTLNSDEQLTLASNFERVEGIETQSRQWVKQSMFIIYGSLLFVGLFLSMMFLTLMFIMIYYKQVTEVFDQNNRYRMAMLSEEEEKKSVAIQLMIIFFLPLAMSFFNVLALFKIAQQLLYLLSYSHKTIFTFSMFITIALFFMIYLVVYNLTSKEYSRLLNRRLR